MRKIYKFLLPVIALICMLAPQTAKATHVMGSDITWKCLGGDTFLITVTAYRDCNGIPLSGTDLGYSTTEGCVSGRVAAGGSKCCGKDITPVCQRSCTRCTDLSCEFEFGIEQWTITAKVVLAAPCCTYTFSWQECCRNGAITTGASGNNFYSEVSCNRCVKNPCDNSPYFTNPPVGIFCVDQCVVFNPGANDDDRDVNGDADSLAYSFGDPLSGPGSTIGYTSPYTSKTPLVYTGDDPDATFTPPLCNGFHLDGETGDIQFRATKTDVTVFVQVIQEYRKDSLGIERLIGTIRRDLQISVIDCPENHAPVITGINGGTNTTIKICAETQTCFTIKAFDIDPKDTVTMSWNNQIAGANFDVKKDGKKWPTGTFCWRPKKSDVRSYPYHFIITALDNACPIPGRASRSFTIYVIAAPEAVYSTKVSGCGLVSFSADAAASSPTSVTSYVWTGEGAPGYGPLFIPKKSGTYQYTRAGTYHYTLTVTGPNGCTQSYTDSVKISPFAEISLPKDQTVCQGAVPITVTATTNHAIKPFVISWDYYPATYNADNVTLKVTKDTVLVARIKDATGCKNYDTMKVFMQKLPKPNLGPDQRGCYGLRDLMATTGLPHMASSSWTRINGKDTFKNFAQGDTLFVRDSGLFAVSVLDSFGCPGHDSINMYFNPLIKAKSNDTDVCVNDSVTLNAGIAGADATFKWYNESHMNILLGTGRAYTIPVATNTTAGYPLEVIINQTRNGVTCIDTGHFIVHVHKKPVPILKPLPDKCVDDNSFNLVPFVDVNHKGGYWYYPKNPSAIVSDYLYPSLMGITVADPTLGWVHYRFADVFKCSSDDSVKIKISTLPQVSAGHDSEICTANGRYILNNQFVAPSGGQWIPAPGTPKEAIEYSDFRDTVFFDPSKVSIDGDYKIIYKVTSKQGLAVCNNSDTVTLTVKTNPTIIISKVDTLCDTGFPVSLNAQPGNGVWRFLDATTPTALTYDNSNQTYTFDPHLAGGGAHKLVYTAWADKAKLLCPSSDSISVYVVSAPPASFKTEDDKYEYCQSHPIVRLVPNQNWPGGAFSGNAVYNTGGVFYFDPSKADTLDSNKNVVSYSVPYDNHKCNLIITRKIAVDARPRVIIQTSSSQCEGLTEIDLSAEADNVTNWTWSSPDGDNVTNQTQSGNSLSAKYRPTTQQIKNLNFSIVLTGGNNGTCPKAKDSIFVTINPRPQPDFSSDTIGCEPFKAAFVSKLKTKIPNNGSVAKYEWDFGDGSAHSFDKNPVHIYTVTNGQPEQTFTVKLTMTSAVYGCTGEITKTNYIKVFATPKPKIFANPQFTTIAVPKIKFDVDEKLSSGVNFKDPTTTFFWTFGDSQNVNSSIRNPEHTYTDTGKFQVRLQVQSNECVGKDSVIIDIRPELIIFIPNVFTPDGKFGTGKPDSKHVFGLKENETFQPIISSYATFEMSVYNRWGELMYHTLNPKAGWDGTYQGHSPVQDAYVYVIKATSYSGKPYTFTGTVTLLY